MSNLQNFKNHSVSINLQSAIKDSQSFKVTFLPYNVTVDVGKGTSVLEAAHKANIYINSICGGDGICGKCKVIIDKGKVDSAPTANLKREEIQQNYVLACGSKVVDDLQVLIPTESRLEGSKILSDHDAKRFSIQSDEHRDSRFEIDPLTKRVYLELDHPSMEDCLADHERLYQAVFSKIGIMPDTMQTGYRVLKDIPHILRKGNWKVTCTIGVRGSVYELIEIEPGDGNKNNLGVAIDVGTTTIVAYLIDLNSAKPIGSEATYNSQMKYGEDYIQRIMYSMQNDALEEMQNSVVTDINGLINILVKNYHKNLHDITAVVCSGNTAMLHFLLALDPSNIRKEPYVPSANNIPVIRAAEVGIGINKRGLLYALPSVAAYVGSDITAGILATGVYLMDELFLFIDIGTNGEVVLGNKEWMVCCSASAGPSFEGSDVHHGMRAARGAIEKLFIYKNNGKFEVEYNTIDNARARGICGSGLLDCIANLVRNGIIDRAGKFQKGLNDERLRETDNGLEFVIVKCTDSDIKTDIIITQADISNLIRSKAAIYAAISTLLKSMGMSIGDISKVYIAGGFGNYLNIKSAITIGMLPDMDPSKIQFVGNTSVAGAKLALVSKGAFEKAKEIASSMTYFDLMGNNKFMDEFMSSNFLPHTNITEFPSVLKELGGGQKEFSLQPKHLI